MLVQDMTQDKLKRGSVQAYAFDLLTIMPLFTVLALLAFYFLTALSTGHLPEYSNPDPKCSAFSGLMPVIYAGLFLTIGTFPVWLMMLLTTIRRNYQTRKIVLSVAIYTLAISAFLFINFATPVMVWFVD